MDKIAVFGKDRQEEYLDRLNLLFPLLINSFKSVYIEARFADYLNSAGVNTAGCVKVEEVPEDAECLLGIGGDGTFLRAAAWQQQRQLPILGINTGHLGFLANHSLADMEHIVDSIQREKCVVESRMQLEVSCPDLPADMWHYALNELSVVRGDSSSMVSIRAYVDGYFLADYLSDALVVCTPTGSTAYNLSAGGPILQPTLESMVLTPVAPHSLTMRPVVIEASSEVKLEISSRGEKCHLGIDGRMFELPGKHAVVTVRKAPFNACMMHDATADFATVLRNKLHWGER
jgi:NAD+ kinase